jgi:hypothetical protein
MNRRKSLQLLLAGGTLTHLTACDSLPAAAIAPWQALPEPPPELAHDPRWPALAWAMLAPSPHNLQPWLADVRQPGCVRLWPDPQRLLPHTDPAFRQILVGCGAFAELLCLAASHAGWLTELTLLPEGPYPLDRLDERPWADVRFVRPAPPPPAEHTLFAAVRQRRTDRQPYAATPPEDRQLHALAQAIAPVPGVELAWSTEPERCQRISALAIKGCRVEFGDPAMWAESVATSRWGADAVAAEPSGTPVLGAAAWWGRRLGVLNDAALRNPQGLAARQTLARFEHALSATPAWAWLVSQDANRAAQLHSGRAFLRLGLAASSQGLALHPCSQTLQEVPVLAPLYQAMHAELGVAAPRRVHMLLRVGHSPNVTPPSPRREVRHILLPQAIRS